MNLQLELEIALEAARRAGAVALRHFATSDTSEDKQDGSPVTAADRECERLIAELLSDRFPEDGFVGEEGTRIKSKSGRRWIVDPIDGTRDFVRRTPYWAVQIALQVGADIVLGIIHLPCLNETAHATLGSGCFWNGTPVVASNITSLQRAVLNVSGFKSLWDIWPTEAVRALTERCWTVRAHGGCYDVVLLVRGKTDIWLSGNGMEWDYAPASILARESGARFLTLKGEGCIDAGHCLICAPGLEQELREILFRAWSP